MSATPARPPQRRIVILDSWLRDRARGSGSAVAVAGLADGLRRLGHRVTVLRPEHRAPWLDLTRLHYNLTVGPRLRSLDPDLVVGIDFDGGLLPAGPRRFRYVVALKGVMADELRFERGAARARFRVLTPLERRNARAADVVLCTSEYSRRIASSAYDLVPSRVQVVPEGIDLDAWAPVARAASSRRPPPPDGGAILTVARQYARKNTETLLRAFALVVRERPSARLRIVGEGPELPRLQRVARFLALGPAVEFAGAVEGLAAVQAEYAAADVFCLPSRQEGFGIVFLEAMASGLPIVAARAGATPEVAPDGETSLLVDADDVGGLAASLLRLLRDGALRAALSSSGLRRWPGFAWPRVAGRFLEASLSGTETPDREVAGERNPTSGCWTA